MENCYETESYCYFVIMQNDVNKKPSGEILLSNDTKLGFEHENDPQPIFHICNGKKMVYFSAESTYVCDDWMRGGSCTNVKCHI